MPAVIFVWGLIIMRIVSPDTGSEFVMTEQKNYSIGDLEISVDTFNIVAKYRDPFLGRIYTEPAKKKKVIVAKSKPKPKAIPDKKWPSISYGGMIKNSKSVKVIALVNINKKSNLMQQGETKYEIELLKIYNDSIEVKFSGVKKYIRK